MKALTVSDISAIEANLFRMVRPVVRDRPTFPWHRDRTGTVTAGQSHSSQALSVDFFGTINVLTSREAILAAWMADLSLVLGGPWSIDLEVTLPRRLLGEKRSTQVDALATGGNGFVLFEFKFTEPNGGGCSQPNPIRKGPNRGISQCDGNFADQMNPVNAVRARCALTGKGIKYWDLVPDVLDIDPGNEYRPCPFVGGCYQWMRNLVAALALSRQRGLSSAFVVVYADGPFPMAHRVTTDEWALLKTLTFGSAVPLRTVSYQRLLAVATATASEHERPILGELSVWMEQKLTLVAKRYEL